MRARRGTLAAAPARSSGRPRRAPRRASRLSRGSRVPSRWRGGYRREAARSDSAPLVVNQNQIREGAARIRAGRRAGEIAVGGDARAGAAGGAATARRGVDGGWRDGGRDRGATTAVALRLPGASASGAEEPWQARRTPDDAVADSVRSFSERRPLPSGGCLWRMASSASPSNQLAQKSPSSAAAGCSSTRASFGSVQVLTPVV